MMAEHILYTLAIVIIIGIYYTRFTGKIYYWWIIIVGSILADIDHFNNFFWDTGILPWSVKVIPFIYIGKFHTLLWLVIFTLLLGTILTKKQIPFYEGSLFLLFGYTIHLIEDILVYPPVYPMLYPVWNQPIGFNIIPETKNLVYAGTEVLNIGIIFLIIAITLYILDFSKHTILKEPE